MPASANVAISAMMRAAACTIGNATASGRMYRDELGRLNARVAAACDELWLCVGGFGRRWR